MMADTFVETITHASSDEHWPFDWCEDCGSSTGPHERHCHRPDCLRRRVELEAANEPTERLR